MLRRCIRCCCCCCYPCCCCCCCCCCSSPPSLRPPRPPPLPGQVRSSTPSFPCQTSTAMWRCQCSLPDPNREHLRSAFAARPQPRSSAPSAKPAGRMSEEMSERKKNVRRDVRKDVRRDARKNVTKYQECHKEWQKNATKHVKLNVREGIATFVRAAVCKHAWDRQLLEQRQQVWACWLVCKALCTAFAKHVWHVLFTPKCLTRGARGRADMFLACLWPASAQCEWCMVMCGWYLCMVLCEWCQVQWREPGAILWSNISVGEGSETCASVSNFPQHGISQQPRGCVEMSRWGSLEELFLFLFLLLLSFFLFFFLFLFLFLLFFLFSIDNEGNKCRSSVTFHISTNWYNKSCFEIFKHVMLSLPATNDKTISLCLLS